MKSYKAVIPLLLTTSLFLRSLNISGQEKDSMNRSFGKTLHVQTLHVTKNYLSPKSLLIPVSFIQYGFSSLMNEELQDLNEKIAYEVAEDASGFKTKVDNYLQYAPAASVYVLNAAGIKGKHRIIDRTIILAMSSILACQLVTTLKYSTHQLRPDGSTYNSFPSGHTTTAFVGAEMLNQEFGWRSPLYSVAGYSMAAGTAFLRMMNNRHWLSDVLAGAGIGMLSTKFSYWVYSKWENRKIRKDLTFY